MARSWGVLALLAAVPLGLVGCHSERPSQTGEALPAITVGYFPNVTHAPAVLGFSAVDGTFAKALAGKASLRARVFNAGPAAMEALHAGALDLSFVGPAPAINAYARGGDLVVLAGVADGGSSLVARKGSGLARVQDLEGRKIAVPQLGNTQDALLRHVLNQSGIRLKDAGGTTSVLPVQNPDILGLFQRGQLDAACVPEPWGSRLVLEAGATVVLDWRALWREGRYPVTVLVARKAFLAQHRDVAQAFVRALAQVIGRLAAGPGGQAPAVNAELKALTGQALGPEVIECALSHLSFTTAPELEALKAMAEVMVEVGYARTVPDLRGLLDTSLLGSP